MFGTLSPAKRLEAALAQMKAQSSERDVPLDLYPSKPIEALDLPGRVWDADAAALTEQLRHRDPFFPQGELA